MLRVVSALLTLLVALPVGAQDFRSSISGRVADATSLGVRDVTVIAINQASNTSQTAITDGAGAYTIPFLLPGVYEVRAELSGFDPFRSDPINVPTAESVSLHITLSVAGIAQTVTASLPQADAIKADRGFNIGTEKLLQLPFSSRNPFMLTTLAPGVTYNGQAIFQRPFDNGAIADWSINGGLNRNNDFLLDGAPNNAIHAGNNIAYVPPVEAVHEVKVMTNGYDAQYGRTGGGVVNVTLKSGSNQWHGAVYEFARRGALDEATFVENARGTHDTGHYLDQYGFELDGPVALGRLYDGRNRTFVMVSAERYREGTPTPFVGTVPDEAQRRGDFSGLRDAAGNLIQIYDPATGRDQNGVVVRDPFPGNIIPSERISPVARQLLTYFPLPSPHGETTGSEAWRNNFVHAPNLALDSFRNLVFKVDHTFGDAHRMFVRYANNRRTEQRNRNGIPTGAAQDGQNPLVRTNNAIVVDWLRAWRQDLLLDARVSANHYVNDVRVADAEGFDLATLGFPADLAHNVPLRLFPRIAVAGYVPLGRGSATLLPTTVVAAQPNLTLVRGASSWRAGLDARWTSYSPVETGFPSMRLEFDRTFTRRTSRSQDITTGNALAALLLGAPTVGVLDVTFSPHYLWRYYAPWLQHDWRVTDRLSVNVGVRWDLSLPVLEKENRLNRGFDAATGGLRFVGSGSDDRSAHRTDWNNVQPRVGAAYAVGRAVIRGGWGRFYLNPVTTGTSHGFSVQHAVTVSEDNYRTSLFPLSNPFPAGIAPPPGRSRGADTLLGGSPSFSNPGFVVPYVDQFSIGFARDLTADLNVEAAYVGSRTRQAATTWGGFNEPSAEFRALCDVTQGGSATYCKDDLLPNPYYQRPGFEGTAHFTSETLSRYDLARPYPQFRAFAEMDRNDGRAWYDSLQLLFRRRLRSDFTASVAYTLSRAVESLVYRDDIARVMDRSPAASDRPHRLTTSIVYTTPVSGGLHELLRGWTVAGTVVAQSGRPWDLPANVAYTGGARLKLAGGRYLQGVAPCVGTRGDNGAVALTARAIAWGCDRAYFIILPDFAERTAPVRTGELRLPRFAQVDVSVSKTIRLAGPARLQLRVDALNALNTPAYDERQYGNDPAQPEFGRIDRDSVTQSNFPRQVQLGIRLSF